MKKENLTPAQRLIVALDVNSVEEAARWVKTLTPMGVTHFKVGLGLFTQTGPAAVEEVHKNGGQVFLDLKFHDIPATAARAAAAAVRLGVWMMNLHIQGGSAMMRRALAAVREEADRTRRKPPMLIGVTVLTSMAEKDLADLGLRKTLKDQVLYLAKLAQSIGLNGIVASAKEATTIRWACGEEFLIVTPGIRPTTGDKAANFLSGAKASSADDQQRTATPREALKAGADYLVVGRPILEASDPILVVQAILKDLE
ncbi:MAG: orotidine-5'-phosphate decarboxylase [Candidatus Omnitrophica bacterium]|nr:orotidine-5'-phosphate decarboxylase [Candidatus Omnitrophota bacterium]